MLFTDECSLSVNETESASMTNCSKVDLWDRWKCEFDFIPAKNNKETDNVMLFGYCIINRKLGKGEESVLVLCSFFFFFSFFFCFNISIFLNITSFIAVNIFPTRCWLESGDYKITRTLRLQLKQILDSGKEKTKSRTI